MRRVRARLEPRGLVLRVEVPTARPERIRGLLGREHLPEGDALLLERTRSVHTFGMRFPIAVALLDARFAVLEVRVMEPGTLLLPRRGVRHVLECGVDEDIRVGDTIVVEAAV